MMDELEDVLRRRLGDAVAELERMPSPPAAEAIARGLGVRRARQRTLGAAIAAVAVLIAVVAPRTGRQGARAPLARPAPTATPAPSVPPPAVPGESAGGVGAGAPAPSALLELAPNVVGLYPPPRPQLPPCPAPAPSRRRPSGIQVTLTLGDRASANGISMQVTVRNAGLLPVASERSSAQEFDLWVEDATHRLVWIWSHDRAFAQSTQQDLFLPGDEREGKARWDRRGCGEHPPALDRGRYVARALWRSGDGGWWSEPVSFEVT